MIKKKFWQKDSDTGDYSQTIGESMALIVNADDFGKSPEVNKAIAECFNKGYINRTTVMVNMPYAEEAFDIAKENGFIDKVGLHINLTEGRPLSDSIKLNSDFCNMEGVFTAAFYRSTKKRLHMDKESVSDITEEVKAQIDKYLSLGFTLKHIDSHHHVHTNYPVYKSLKILSRYYNFSSIRLSRNLYRGGSLFNRTYKSFINKKFRQICNHTTDYFGSFKDVVDYFATGSDEQIVDSTTNIVNDFCVKHDLEVMVHPMYSKEGVLVDSDIPFEREILLYEVR